MRKMLRALSMPIWLLVCVLRTVQAPLDSVSVSFVMSSFIDACCPDQKTTDKRQKSCDGYSEDPSHHIQHIHPFSHPLLPF